MPENEMNYINVNEKYTLRLIPIIRFNIEEKNKKYYNYMTENVEKLFLNPDGIRTRYCIGWNGYGRYIPNTLRIYDNVDERWLEPNTEYTEEDNGIFFNFIEPPPEDRTHEGYRISYEIREDDLNFSKGTNSTFPGEEYFLFPNWIGAPGCGDGFWVAKYITSRIDATTTHYGNDSFPVSKKNKYLWDYATFSTAKYAIARKGSQFHLMRNRERANIAYWCVHHKINQKLRGATSKYAKNIDSANTDATTFYLTDGYHTLTGMGPPTWNHNLKENGITDLAGNAEEWLDGLFVGYKGTGSGNAVIAFDENNKYPTNYINSPQVLPLQLFLGDKGFGETIDVVSGLIYYPDNNWKYEALLTNNSNVPYIKADAAYQYTSYYRVKYSSKVYNKTMYWGGDVNDHYPNTGLFHMCICNNSYAQMYSTVSFRMVKDL